MKKHLFYLPLCLALLMFSCKKEADQPKSPPVDEGKSELVTLKSGVVVEKKGDKYVWGGDMRLSPTQLKALDEKGSIFTETTTKPGPDRSIHPVYNIPMKAGPNNTAIPRALSIYPTPYNMWAMVRFVYNANLPWIMRLSISQALHDIEAVSNVRFYNATGQPTVDPVYGFEYPYIDFVYVGASDVSESYVGRIGGRQEISLADFAAWQPGVITHEVCHAIGMLHEQQRPDRDNFVTINWSNLTSDGVAQFQKRTTNYLYMGAYDFNSVMGYSSRTSSTSIVHDVNQVMYTRLDGTEIAQGWQMSDNDRSWANYLYIPYIARSDVYAELADIVYKPDNTIMTAQERLDFQAYLNNGDPNPPPGGRIPNDF